MTWADFVVRGTLVLAAGFAASFAFGRASAALRHLIWTAAFVALLALPVALWHGAEGGGGGMAGGAAQAGVGRPKPRPDRLRARTGTRRRRGAERSRVADRAQCRIGLLRTSAGLLIVAARFLAGAVRTVRMVRLARPAAYAQALADRRVPRPRDRPSGARAGKHRCGGAHDLGHAASGCAAARSGARLAGCAAARRRAA